jgi:hypothetical protein
MRRITVSEIRRHLWFAAGSAGEGERATKLLGRMFHDLFAQLMDSESPLSLDRILADASGDLEEWKTLVLKEAYRAAIFPRLQAHRHVLPEMTLELLSFWTAVRELCQWLCELRWSWTEGGQKPCSQENWILPEEPLRVVLNEQDRKSPVELTGSADALVRRPDGAWCVVELKLGQAAPEADLAQACLYHLMQFTQSDAPPAAGNALAVVQFTPKKQETLFSSDDVREAQKRLLDLIGEWAGLEDVGPAPPPAPKPVEPAIPSAPKPTVSTQSLGERIVQAFAQYQVHVEIDGAPIVGPTFVRYPLRLGRGVKVKKVESLDRDIKVALGLEAAPFIHDANGRMVIDVQRPDRQVVLFEDVLAQFPKPVPTGTPKAPIGVNLNGKLEFVDFTDSGSPHLLVAGTTSSGKSEWLISAIAGLNLLNTPHTLRYVLIDPKRNAFAWMKDSEFLLKPLVFPDETNIVEVFESLVAEMERRYALFEGDSDLQTYLIRTGKAIPRIVCICDEFYDLLAGNAAVKRELEGLIVRLGSKARAAGIHLILATQQPSRRVIAGVLDTNLPARVGLKTSKDTESRMLLGTGGAENLLGRGDLLFKAVGEPKRYQGVYLPEKARPQYAHFRNPAKVMD